MTQSNGTPRDRCCDDNTTVTRDRSDEAFVGGDRRRFLGMAGGLATLVLPELPGITDANAQGAQADPAVSNLHEAYRRRALEVRVAAARSNHEVPIPPHPSNGDEAKYPNRIGSDTRGLPHDRRGEVDAAAYRTALKAYDSGDPADFEAIPLAGTRKQQNPLGSLAINLTGLNNPQYAIPPAPPLDSAARAAEAVEVYWQSLLRDIPLAEFRDDTNNRDVIAAADECNKLSAFYGPRIDGRITPSTLFRGTALYVDSSDASGRTGRYVTPPGTLTGPYISQFLLKDAPHGAHFLNCRIRTVTPDSNFLTDYEEWLSVQNGNLSGKAARYVANPRLVTTGRDLAECVHAVPAAFWGAALLLGTPVDHDNPSYGGIGTRFSSSNPYLNSKTQGGSHGTFALPYVQSLLPLAASRGVRASYWQKWYVHRTLRPEAYAGLVHHRIANHVDEYPIHSDALNSRAIARSFGRLGTYLLSHVYPEGAPLHSSYSGGTAVLAGSNVTILKAFFDEIAIVPDPVQPDPHDPSRVIPYVGPPLTVGGELNKLAWNFGIGRNWSGIHWRSDMSAALALGEEVAMSLLREEHLTYRERFEGFRFTRFDGTTATI
jgi:hypothetical protein